MPDQGQSTYDSTLLLKGTFPYSYLEGKPTDKSKASPPVARQEQAQRNSLHGRENFHY
jgi:hypothetical protein